MRRDGGDRDALVGVRGRHADVGDDDVRRLRLDQRLQRGQVGGGAHQLEVRRALDQPYETVPEQGVVLGQHDAGSHADRVEGRVACGDIRSSTWTKAADGDRAPPAGGGGAHRQRAGHRGHRRRERAVARPRADRAGFRGRASARGRRPARRPRRRAPLLRRGRLRARGHQRRARADGRRPDGRGRRHVRRGSSWSSTRPCEQRIAAIIARFPRIDQDPAARDAGIRKQAFVPRGAVVLEPVGTAPGLVVSADARPARRRAARPAARADGHVAGRAGERADEGAAGERAPGPGAAAALLRAVRGGGRGDPARPGAGTRPLRGRGDDLPAPLRAGGRPAAAARRRGHRAVAGRGAGSAGTRNAWSARTGRARTSCWRGRCWTGV